MAFDIRLDSRFFARFEQSSVGLATSSQGLRPGVAVNAFSYRTEDDKATVTAAGYFDELDGRVALGDTISVLQVTNRGAENQAYVDRYDLVVSSLAGGAVGVTEWQPSVALPDQVDAGEITAGNETELRSYSPADVVSFINQHGVDEAALALKMPLAPGLENRTDTTLAIDPTTRIFTLGKVNNFTAYAGSPLVQYDFTASQTVTLPNVSGLYYVYIDTNGVLTASTNTFDLTLVAPVSLVLFTNAADNGGTAAATTPTDERHSPYRNALAHINLHSTIGSYYRSGLAGTFGDVNGSMSIATGTFYDEDLPHTLSSPATQAYLRYRAGAVWKQDPLSSDIRELVGGVLQWDDAGTLTSVAVNGRVNYWVFLKGTVTPEVHVVVGQSNPTSDALAIAQSISSVTLPPDLVAESRLLYSVCYQRTGGTPAGDIIPGGVVDRRAQTIVGGAVVTGSPITGGQNTVAMRTASGSGDLTAQSFAAFRRATNLLQDTTRVDFLDWCRNNGFDAIDTPATAASTFASALADPYWADKIAVITESITVEAQVQLSDATNHSNRIVEGVAGTPTFLINWTNPGGTDASMAVLIGNGVTTNSTLAYISANCPHDVTLNKITIRPAPAYAYTSDIDEWNHLGGAAIGGLGLYGDNLTVLNSDIWYGRLVDNGDGTYTASGAMATRQAGQNIWVYDSIFRSAGGNAGGLGGPRPFAGRNCGYVRCKMHVSDDVLNLATPASGLMSHEGIDGYLYKDCDLAGPIRSIIITQNNQAAPYSGSIRNVYAIDCTHTATTLYALNDTNNSYLVYIVNASQAGCVIENVGVIRLRIRGARERLEADYAFGIFSRDLINVYDRGGPIRNVLFDTVDVDGGEVSFIIGGETDVATSAVVAAQVEGIKCQNMRIGKMIAGRYSNLLAKGTGSRKLAQIIAEPSQTGEPPVAFYACTFDSRPVGSLIDADGVEIKASNCVFEQCYVRGVGANKAAFSIAASAKVYQPNGTYSDVACGSNTFLRCAAIPASTAAGTITFSGVPTSPGTPITSVTIQDNSTGDRLSKTGAFTGTAIGDCFMISTGANAGRTVRVLEIVTTNNVVRTDARNLTAGSATIVPVSAITIGRQFHVACIANGQTQIDGVTPEYGFAVGTTAATTATALQAYLAAQLGYPFRAYAWTVSGAVVTGTFLSAELESALPITLSPKLAAGATLAATAGLYEQCVEITNNAVLTPDAEIDCSALTPATVNNSQGDQITVGSGTPFSGLVADDIIIIWSSDQAAINGRLARVKTATATVINTYLQDLAVTSPTNLLVQRIAGFTMGPDSSFGWHTSAPGGGQAWAQVGGSATASASAAVAQLATLSGKYAWQKYSSAGGRVDCLPIGAGYDAPKILLTGTAAPQSVSATFVPLDTQTVSSGTIGVLEAAGCTANVYRDCDFSRLSAAFSPDPLVSGSVEMEIRTAAGRAASRGTNESPVPVATTPVTMVHGRVYIAKSGASVLNLPAATGLGGTIQVINASGGSVTVAPNGSQTIEGLPGSLTLANGETAAFIDTAMGSDEWATVLGAR